jgi:hypothetical protein
VGSCKAALKSAFGPPMTAAACRALFSSAWPDLDRPRAGLHLAAFWAGAGAAQLGFWLPQVEAGGDDADAIDRLFAPEFRNRLDAIVPFACLPEAVISRVVDKFILQLEAQFSGRNVTIELTNEEREGLIKNGYDEVMSARPMARVIQARIKTPLADEVSVGSKAAAWSMSSSPATKQAQRSSASSTRKDRHNRSLSGSDRRSGARGARQLGR